MTVRSQSREFPEEMQPYIYPPHQEPLPSDVIVPRRRGICTYSVNLSQSTLSQGVRAVYTSVTIQEVNLCFKNSFLKLHSLNLILPTFCFIFEWAIICLCIIFFCDTSWPKMCEDLTITHTNMAKMYVDTPPNCIQVFPMNGTVNATEYEYILDNCKLTTLMEQFGEGPFPFKYGFIPVHSPASERHV